MRRIYVVLGVLGLAGCDGASTTAEGEDGQGVFTDDMPEDLPAGECDGETDGCESDDESGGESSTGGVDAAAQTEAPSCERSSDCTGAGACVATDEDGAPAQYVCRFACVPTLDEAAWCRDDAACCDADATCTARGYCVVLEAPNDGEDASPGGSTFSDTMPEDLPAGGGRPPESVATPAD